MAFSRFLFASSHLTVIILFLFLSLKLAVSSFLLLLSGAPLSFSPSEGAQSGDKREMRRTHTQRGREQKRDMVGAAVMAPASTMTTTKTTTALMRERRPRRGELGPLCPCTTLLRARVSVSAATVRGQLGSIRRARARRGRSRRAASAREKFRSFLGLSSSSGMQPLF